MEFTTVRFTFTPACVAEVEVEVDRVAWEAMDDAERAQMALAEAMDHGLSWSWQEVEPAPSPVVAWVTVDEAGRVRDDSTVTIGEWTAPVPERASNGMRLAAMRLAETLAGQGWRMIEGADDDTSQPGMVGIPVEQIKED